MPQKQANDGGHSVFTDHRIQRTPAEGPVGEPNGIVAWREPPAELAKRNLGIGQIEAGSETRSWPQIVAGYRTLTEVQHQFPDDCEMYQSIGNALFMGQKFTEAELAFEIAQQCDPQSSSTEASLGSAYAASGKNGDAEFHLERALDLDPINLTAAEQLISVYEKDGKNEKAEILRSKISKLFH
jgi:tetratricopeptide (TPR) repeat protein